MHAGYILMELQNNFLEKTSGGQLVQLPAKR